MILEIPDNLEIQTTEARDLPGGWMEFTDYSKCHPIGNAWYDDGNIPILKVPSAVLPESFNYMINSHPDFKKIKVVKITALIPDERIEDLLKNIGNCRTPDNSKKARNKIVIYSVF